MAMQPQPDFVTNAEVQEVLDAFGGDERAAIAALIVDIEFLAARVATADRAVSRGFTRGWHPGQPRPSGR